MKRSEFMDSPPGSVEDLIDFANDNNLDAAVDMFPSGDLDEKIFEDIRELSSHLWWYQVRDRLDNIDSDAEYYVWNGELDYAAVGYDDLYESIIEEMDNGDLWDSEDEDDEDEEDEEESGEEDEDDLSDDSDSYDSLIPEEPLVFSIDTLFDPTVVSVIRAEAKEGERKADEARKERAESFRRSILEKTEAERKAEEAEEADRINGFSFMF